MNRHKRQKIRNWYDLISNRFVTSSAKPKQMVHSYYLTNEQMTPKNFQQVVQIIQKRQEKCQAQKHSLSLFLSFNDVGSRGCQILQNANFNLFQLSISENGIDEIGCMYLSKLCKNLRQLNLINNRIGDMGCKYLSQGQWRQLEIIYLNQNYITDSGCIYLSKSMWVNLRQLNCAQNYISSKGLKWLCKGPWNKLQVLNLVKNQIDDRGWELLNKMKIIANNGQVIVGNEFQKQFNGFGRQKFNYILNNSINN